MSETLNFHRAVASQAWRRSDDALRVAIFTGNYNYVVDGPSRALNRLVAHLEREGHEALVFAPTTKTPAIRHEGTLISVPSVSLPPPRNEFRFSLGLPPAAKARLDAFRPSIIHISTPDLLGLGALNYARDRGIPAVASFHTRFDTYPRYYNAQWAEKHVLSYMRWFYSRCAQVYPPTESMAEELAAAGVRSDMRLWERGVDAELFNPGKRDLALRAEMGFAPDDVVVLFVGRVVLEKGIEVFAEAVRAAAGRNPKIRALIVGDGPERARFESLLPEGVFRGFLQGEDLARAYASADIFLNPSVTETFGQVTLEAMASGLPCVCAAAAGSMSLVVDRITGVLAPANGNAEDYARRLESLAADAALRKRYAAAARARALKYDWTAVLDGLIDNYRDAVEGAAPGQLRA